MSSLLNSLSLRASSVNPPFLLPVLLLLCSTAPARPRHPLPLASNPHPATKTFLRRISRPVRQSRRTRFHPRLPAFLPVPRPRRLATAARPVTGPPDSPPRLRPRVSSRPPALRRLDSRLRRQTSLPVSLRRLARVLRRPVCLRGCPRASSSQATAGAELSKVFCASQYSFQFARASEHGRWCGIPFSIQRNIKKS